MKKCLFITGVIIILLFTACNTSEPEEHYLHPITLLGVIDTANARRHTIAPADYYRLLQFTEGREAVPLDVLARTFRPSSSSPEYLSVTMLRRDIYDFFYALRAYSMYLYFGGNNVFLPIRDKILQELDMQEYWYIHEFIDLVQHYLSPAIVDEHFYFGSSTLPSVFTTDYQFFTYSGRFRLTENGIVNKVTALYVQKISLPCRPYLDFDLHNSFRLSICENGEEFYYALVLHIRMEQYSFVPENVRISYIDNNGTISVEDVPLQMVTTQLRPWDAMPTLEWMQGIPIISLTGWGFRGSVGAVQFIEYAEELQCEPVIIVDLRSNMGGEGWTISEWFYRILGTAVVPMHDMLTPANSDVYQIISRRGNYEVVSNIQLIIVLVDRFSMSASEVFISYALAVENTLIVGQNTGGVLISHGGTTGSLWYSGVSFNANRGGTIFPYGIFTEAIGFAPDIWVTGDALVATLGMLEHHFESWYISRELP